MPAGVLELPGRWPPAPGKRPGTLESTVAAGRFLHDSPGQCGGLLPDERIVHQEERLERYRRTRAHVGGGVGVRTVEDRKVRVLHQPLSNQVHRPTIARVSCLEWIVLRPR